MLIRDPLDVARSRPGNMGTAPKSQLRARRCSPLTVPLASSASKQSPAQGPPRLLAALAPRRHQVHDQLGSTESVGGREAEEDGACATLATFEAKSKAEEIGSLGASNCSKFMVVIHQHFWHNCPVLFGTSLSPLASPHIKSSHRHPSPFPPPTGTTPQPLPLSLCLHLSLLTHQPTALLPLPNQHP
jgi:hypothetical protein